MDGWKLDRTALRTLREQYVTQTGMAKLLDCHLRHYARLESEAPTQRGSEPSALLAYAICRELTKLHNRPIELQHIATPIPSRRKGAA